MAGTRKKQEKKKHTGLTIFDFQQGKSVLKVKQIFP